MLVSSLIHCHHTRIKIRKLFPACSLGNGNEYKANNDNVGSGDLEWKKDRWYHVLATWDGKHKRLYIDGKMRGEPQAFQEKIILGTAPLRLGAYGDEHGCVDKFLDGDISMPAIYRVVLDQKYIDTLYAHQGKARQYLKDAKDKEYLHTNTIAYWPLNENKDKALQVVDASGNGYDGIVINSGTRMVGGPGLGKVNVERYGNYDPETDHDRGHGLRFASDDLYDCRWTVTHEVILDEKYRSGMYCAEFKIEGSDTLYNVMFTIRQDDAEKRSKILVIASTNTWKAYTPPFDTTAFKKPQDFPRKHPAFTLYPGENPHEVLQSAYQVGLRMPCPAGNYRSHEYKVMGKPGVERFLHLWLDQERNGNGFDVVSDLDLHQNPKILDGYKVVFINGHSEYWSVPMYKNIEMYLNRNGKLIVLSGNTMWWRVCFDDDSSLMECRKFDTPETNVGTDWPRRLGWHFYISEEERTSGRGRGGLMHECGYPGYKLIGLQHLGVSEEDNMREGSYCVRGGNIKKLNELLEILGADHLVKVGTVFGKCPNEMEQRELKDGFKINCSIIYHEFDVLPSTLRAMSKIQMLEPPPDAVKTRKVEPKDPDGMFVLAKGELPWDSVINPGKADGVRFDFYTQDYTRSKIPKADQTTGEMIYWERTKGGVIFNAGTIASGSALGCDKTFQDIIRALLTRFLQ
jgi:N,N-dimethylformamidase